MFEKYNFSGVFIQIQAVLTLYAQGAYRKDEIFEVQKYFLFLILFLSITCDDSISLLVRSKEMTDTNLLI